MHSITLPPMTERLQITFEGIRSAVISRQVYTLACGKTQLRYGENPHQRAAVYSDPSERSANLVSARQLSGKELSYNNLLDLDSALGNSERLCGASGECD